MNCYRHPKVETTLRCSRCEKYICPDCAVLTPVGYRCRECGKERSATQVLAPKHLALGLGLGIGLPFATGYAAQHLYVPLLLLFAGAVVGSGIGRLIKMAIGMKSSQLIATVAAASYFAGVLATPIYYMAQSRGELDAATMLSANVWMLLFAGIAAACTMVQLK